VRGGCCKLISGLIQSCCSVLFMVGYFCFVLGSCSSCLGPELCVLFMHAVHCYVACQLISALCCCMSVGGCLERGCGCGG
jgi:hypothetical protein